MNLEFWAQGDEERRLELPISRMCDRQQGMATVPTGQPQPKSYRSSRHMRLEVPVHQARGRALHGLPGSRRVTCICLNSFTFFNYVSRRSSGPLPGCRSIDEDAGREQMLREGAYVNSKPFESRNKGEGGGEGDVRRPFSLLTIRKTSKAVLEVIRVDMG